MSGSRRLLRSVVAASDVGLQLRPALETTVVAGLILLLAALSVENFRALIAYSEIGEAFSLATPVKLDLVEYRAVHGEWPTSTTELPPPSTRTVPVSG